MEHQQKERRREVRYPAAAKVVVLRSDGERITAAAVNISDTGMSLDFKEPTDLRIGDEVIIELELKDDPEHAFSTWGVARIMRKVGPNLGIQFSAGTFELERVAPLS